ncbi:MAG: SIMPL domain-containing protein [Leptolyngbya sp. SIO3F4]|nr:SIMPL domain-containing protein [Leptolyngbya sp. SIO3F4]
MQSLIKLLQRLLPWIFAALIVVTCGLPAVAQETSTPRMLAISGHGRAQAPTSLAQISLGISDKGETAKGTYSQVDKRSSAVVKLLKSAKVDDVKTSNINLTVDTGRDGKPQKGDYDGYQTIEFQVPADEIGVLDDAIATGIDRINSIRYVASENAIATARNTALEKAMADAQDQAKVALDELGFSIQEIVDIQVGDARVETPQPNTAPPTDSYSSWSKNVPLLASGEQTVDMNVTLKIRY